MGSKSCFGLPSVFLRSSFGLPSVLLRSGAISIHPLVRRGACARIDRLEGRLAPSPHTHRALSATTTVAPFSVAGSSSRSSARTASRSLRCRSPRRAARGAARGARSIWWRRWALRRPSPCRYASRRVASRRWLRGCGVWVVVRRPAVCHAHPPTGWCSRGVLCARDWAVAWRAVRGDEPTVDPWQWVEVEKGDGGCAARRHISPAAGRRSADGVWRRLMTAAHRTRVVAAENCRTRVWWRLIVTAFSRVSSGPRVRARAPRARPPAAPRVSVAPPRLGAPRRARRVRGPRGVTGNDATHTRHTSFASWTVALSRRASRPSSTLSHASSLAITRRHASTLVVTRHRSSSLVVTHRHLRRHSSSPSSRRAVRRPSASHGQRTAHELQPV